LKHRFFDFTQVAFWFGQEEVNESPVIGDHLKDRFPDITKVGFWACQETEKDCTVVREGVLDSQITLVGVP